MENSSYLEKIFRSFQRYYTVKTENIPQPFDAEAEFISHTENYFLVKSAKLSEFDSNEYVFFKQNDFLSIQMINEYSSIAWNEGLSRVKPSYGHKNSDITLVLLAQNLETGASKTIKKTNKHISYRFGFFGWSNFKLVVKELSSDLVFCNRMGSDLKKLLSKIKSD